MFEHFQIGRVAGRQAPRYIVVIRDGGYSGGIDVNEAGDDWLIRVSLGGGGVDHSNFDFARAYLCFLHSSLLVELVVPLRLSAVCSPAIFLAPAMKIGSYKLCFTRSIDIVDFTKCLVFVKWDLVS